MVTKLLKFLLIYLISFFILKLLLKEASDLFIFKHHFEDENIYLSTISALSAIITFNKIGPNEKKFKDIFGFSKPNIYWIYFTSIGVAIPRVSVLFWLINGHAILAINESIKLQTIIVKSFGLILIALEEELLFRLVPVKYIFDKQNNLIKVIACSTLFSIVHGINLPDGYIFFLNVFLGGAVLSILYLASKSILPSIFFHFLWNFTQLILLGIPISGTTFTQSIFHITLTTSDAGKYGLEGTWTPTILLFITTIFLIKHIDGRPLATKS